MNFFNKTKPKRVNDLENKYSIDGLTQEKLNELLDAQEHHDLKAGLLTNEIIFKNMKLDNLDFSNRNLAEIKFINVVMNHVIFNKVSLNHAWFDGVIMTNCTITNSNLEYANFRNCDIYDSIIINVYSNVSSMQRGILVNVALDETSFKGSTVAYVNLFGTTKETKSFIQARDVGNPSCLQLDVKKSSKQIVIDWVKELVNQLKSDEKEKFQEYISSLSKEGKLDSSSFNYYYSQGYQHALENVINSLKENKHL